MIRQLLTVLSLIALGSTGVADATEARTVTITIMNQTPTVTVVPSIQTLALGSAPVLFTNTTPNTYEYKFPIANDQWFDDVDIDLLWKNAYRNNDATTKDFDERVILRIRRDFPASFSFPIYFSNDRSQDEMSRLEHERDPTQQFEVALRGEQIATYYRDTFSPQHPFAKRAAKIFFYGAIKLAETEPYDVEMNDTAEPFIIAAFGGSSSYSDRAEVAKSKYWNDLSQIDSYAAKGDCSTANLILAAFQAKKEDDPEAFAVQYGKEPNVLDEKAAIINSKCNTTNAKQGN